MTNPTEAVDVEALVAELEGASQACQSSAWRRQDGGQELSLASIALDKAATALSTLAAELEMATKAHAVRVSAHNVEAELRLASEARATALEAERDEMRVARDFWENRENEALKRAIAAEAHLAKVREALEQAEQRLALIAAATTLGIAADAIAGFADEAREALRSTVSSDGRGDQMLASASCPQETKMVEDLHGYCGSDAARWAEQFRLMAIKLGYSDMDEGWLIGWFANAIERSIQVRHPPALPDYLADATPNHPPSEARADVVKDRLRAAVLEGTADEVNGKPCGNIITKGCEAAEYVDPDDATGAFVDAIVDGVISALTAQHRADRRRVMGSLKDTDVEWVVNDNAELGVKIGEQFFWLYKGESLVYENGKHDDGRPMRWRHVYKREFGECCHPIDMATVMAAARAGYHVRDIAGFDATGEEWADVPAAQRASQEVREDG